MAFLSQSAFVDSFQFGDVADQRDTAMHVQIVQHKHPAGSRIGLHGVVDVLGKVGFRSCRFNGG